MEEKELTQQEYKPGPIDGMIVSTLQSMDRGSFWTKDKILFFKEVSYLLTGGVSIVDAMHIIGQSSDNYALKEISRSILAFLRQGKSFSYALNRLPDYFDQGDYTIVKAWEMSGNLPMILQSLSNEYVYVNEMKNKYIGALMYPMILVVISIVAVFALFLLVLPGIFSIATSFQNLELPWITRTLNDISVFFQYQWKTIIGVVVGLWLFGWIFFSTDFGKKSRFSILLNIPLIGKMTKFFYLVKFCRYTKLMMSAWMNYLQTFSLLHDILGIAAYQDMIERIIVGLNKWETIYSTLQYETDLIPSDVAVMIKVWEETANLPVSLENVLKMYEEDLNVIIGRSSKIIEPIMLVGVWGIILVIALWIFWLIGQIMEGAGL
jgi:type II secretory pathway component PulF